MSKGPCKALDTIAETLAACPSKRFTYAELADFVFAVPIGDHPRGHIVYVSRMVKRLEEAGKVTIERKGKFKTVQAVADTVTRLRALLKNKVA